MKKIKYNENIIVAISIFILSILICNNFIKFHTVPDTYNVLQKQYDYCNIFLKDGRLISALFLLFRKSFKN